MAIIALTGAAGGHTTPGGPLAVAHPLSGASAGHSTPAGMVFLTLNSPRTLVYGRTGTPDVRRVTRARRLAPTVRCSRMPIVKGAVTPMAGAPDATYTQRPTEAIPYVFDFTDACKDQNGAIVDSVASAVWDNSPGITLGTEALGSTTVKRPVSGGTADSVYVVICTATLASGAQRTLSVAITIVDNPPT